jgi:predicted nucleotidyltransferase
VARKDQTLHKIVRLLKREFNPSRLYFFGSRAAGTWGPDSDYDFVMVVPRYKGDRMKTWEQCRDLIRKECDVPVDVFTYSESEFRMEKDDFNSIPETAVNTGQEIDLGSV